MKQFAVRSSQLTVSRQRSHLYFVLILSIAYCLLPIASSSQSTAKQKKEQLQQQMKKLQDEIKTISAALKKTSASKEKNMGEILSLQAKIKSRQRLIDNISYQIHDLDETISQTSGEITAKTNQVEKMKAEYAKLLRKTYENATLQNETAFLLSSNSFYEAFLRYNYLIKIAEYRRAQAKGIQKAIGELQVKKEDLQENKAQKQNLLLKQTNQKQELEQEKKEKDEAVAQLQDREKRLKKQQEEKNKAARQLNSKIQAIIEEEIRQARKKAEELARKNAAANKPPVKTETTEIMPLTPEERELSNNFSNNRGKLPWPVLKGHVISQFGKHEHAAIKGVMVENNGIDIKTEKDADVRAVFGGIVVSVFSLPTTQTCIIIKHGEFFTVYANIENASVKANQKITTKQTIGRLHYDKNESLTKVHIEIWKGKDKMDPELWLAN